MQPIRFQAEYGLRVTKSRRFQSAILANVTILNACHMCDQLIMTKLLLCDILTVLRRELCQVKSRSCPGCAKEKKKEIHECPLDGPCKSIICMVSLSRGRRKKENSNNIMRRHPLMD